MPNAWLTILWRRADEVRLWQRANSIRLRARVRQWFSEQHRGWPKICLNCGAWHVVPILGNVPVQHMGLEVGNKETSKGC